MADLTERTSTGATKLVSASGPGIEGGFFSADAFGRLRVSNPTTLFDSSLTQGLQPTLWETLTAGGGSVSYLGTESAAQLSVGTANGDYAIRESHGRIHYNPAKSHLSFFTGVFGSGVSNVVKRIGLFDENDGVFFQVDSTGLAVCLRSSASGSVVDTVTYQANWNILKLNGTDQTGISLDTTKTIIFGCDLEWLGVGIVRWFVVIGGIIYYVHQEDGSNNLTRVYMATANLPVRYEIRNTAASAGASMRQICTSVQSEGGIYETVGIINGINMGTVTRTVTNRQAVLSIRLKTTYAGKTNRMNLVPLNVSVRSSADAFWELVLQQYHNGDVSLGGTPAWSDVDTNNSGAEYSTNVTTVGTAGRPLVSGYLTGGGSRDAAVVRELGDKSVMALNAAGTNSDVLHVVATSFAGNASVTATANWREVY